MREQSQTSLGTHRGSIPTLTAAAVVPKDVSITKKKKYLRNWGLFQKKPCPCLLFLPAGCPSRRMLAVTNKRPKTIAGSQTKTNGLNAGSGWNPISPSEIYIYIYIFFFFAFGENFFVVVKVEAQPVFSEDSWLCSSALVLLWRLPSVDYVVSSPSHVPFRDLASYLAAAASLKAGPMKNRKGWTNVDMILTTRKHFSLQMWLKGFIWPTSYLVSLRVFLSFYKLHPSGGNQNDIFSILAGPFDLL